MILFSGTLPLNLAEHGSGRPVLVLHGGAGAASMAGLSAALASRYRSMLATHPGFDAQPRPDWFRRIDDLTLAYLALIEQMDLSDVVVVGNSAGGWIAAELAVRASPRITAIVLIDAVGLEPTPDGGGIADPTKLAPEQTARLAFHDPSKMRFDPAQAPVIAANQKVLKVYGGEPFMNDPSLRNRLPQIAIPTLVLWGESDGIVTPSYGKQFATLIPSAQFRLIKDAGHFPQIEQLDQVVSEIQSFLDV